MTSTPKPPSTSHEHRYRLKKYCIELLTTTALLDGSDNIVYQGWLTKKGKIKWNARWCALLKVGYLNYIDADQKQDIRSIDISAVQINAEKSNNLYSLHSLSPFHCILHFESTERFS